jgi:hypothetical protein
VELNHDCLIWLDGVVLNCRDKCTSLYWCLEWLLDSPSHEYRGIIYRLPDERTGIHPDPLQMDVRGLTIKFANSSR